MITPEVKITTAPEVLALAASPNEQGFASSYINYVQMESEDEETVIDEFEIPVMDVNLKFTQGTIPSIPCNFMEVDIIFPEGKTDTLRRLLDAFLQRDSGLLDGKNIYSQIIISPEKLNGEVHLIFEDMFLYSLSAYDPESSPRVLKMLFFDTNYAMLVSEDFNLDSIDADIRREENMYKLYYEEDEWEEGEEYA